MTLTLKFPTENPGGGNVATFSAFTEMIKNFERTQLALTPWRARSYRLCFISIVSISGARAHWLIQMI